MKSRFGNLFKILRGVDRLALESLCKAFGIWVTGFVCCIMIETDAIYK